MKYKIPPTPKVSGVGWGGEPPIKKPMKKATSKVHKTSAKSAAKKLGY